MALVRSAMRSAIRRASFRRVSPLCPFHARTIFARRGLALSRRSTRAVGSLNPTTCDRPASASARPKVTIWAVRLGRVAFMSQEVACTGNAPTSLRDHEGTSREPPCPGIPESVLRSSHSWSEPHPRPAPPMSPRLRTVVRWLARLAAGAFVLIVVVGASVYGISEHHVRRHYVVPEHPIVVPTDSASVARGAHLAAVRGCAGCHRADLSGQLDFDDPLVGRLAMPNLTRGGRGAELTDRDWERAVRHGARRDDTPLVVMPAHLHTRVSDEDLGAIVAYARSHMSSASFPRRRPSTERISRRRAPTVMASTSPVARSPARRRAGSRRRTSRRPASGITPKSTSCARYAKECVPAERSSTNGCRCMA